MSEPSADPTRVRAARADVAVVGGGPAGLMGAIYLARFRRSVVLVDAGHSRVARIPRTHNYPGIAQGIAGAGVRDALRAQLREYPVQVLDRFVQFVQREPEGFRLHMGGSSVSARFVLLATGVTDIPPVMTHLRAALDEGLLRFCPVCDAYEVAGRSIGVYADGPAGMAEALYLRHFSADITLFMARGGADIGERERGELARAGIRWNDMPVEAIRRVGEHVVLFQGGVRAYCDTLYCALGVTVHSELAGNLGASLDSAGYVQADAHHATRVPGLYVAGDVSVGLNQIAVAMGGAAIAASAMHRALPDSWAPHPAE
jgi:thioredoxin reductase (NADPH)